MRNGKAASRSLLSAGQADIPDNDVSFLFEGFFIDLPIHPLLYHLLFPSPHVLPPFFFAREKYEAVPFKQEDHRRPSGGFACFPCVNAKPPPSSFS